MHTTVRGEEITLTARVTELDYSFDSSASPEYLVELYWRDAGNGRRLAMRVDSINDETLERGFVDKLDIARLARYVGRGIVVSSRFDVASGQFIDKSLSQRKDRRWREMSDGGNIVFSDRHGALKSYSR